MDYDVAESHWRAITMIEAQDLLMQMRLADYPNMKQPDRRKWHRDMHRLAYPPVTESKQVTTDELASKIGAILRG